MFQSGCRVGEEYKMAWELMREEAGQGTAYLGEELGKHLGAEAAGDGQRSCTGGMRKAVTGK